ncbi:rhodanese-like domain-containing protein [Arthrobacter sp. 92]|uniref:rhodanese-like domain-containing protein n=1 Tax=Arthrobacter sp. 92 TaxID=3418175 RepID=UPI003D07AAA6
MVSRSEVLAFVDAKLAYEIDTVAAADAQTSGAAMIVDTRKQLSWDQGHVRGALHLPADNLEAQLATLPRDRTLIVYGWGPSCNGATHTARRLIDEGFDVRELRGGYEYWVRNRFPVEQAAAVMPREADPLVTAELH